MSKFDGLLGNATFSRNSPAYALDGVTSIASGSPRYENGRFQNLLTKNQSDIETDMSSLGTNNGGTVFSIDNTTSWQGNSSLKVIGDGTNVGQGVYCLNINAKSGVTYIFSAYVKGSGTIRLTLSGSLTTVNSSVITLTNSWTRYFVSGTATSNGVLYPAIATNVAQSITFNVDGMQLEEAIPGQTTPTDWRPGQSGKGIIIEEATTNIARNSDFEIMNSIKQRVFFDNFDRTGVATFSPGFGYRAGMPSTQKGIMITQKDRLEYSRGTQVVGNWYDNFDPYQGTISFWIRPNWNGNDGLDHYLFVMTNDTNNTTYLQIIKNSSSNLTFSIYNSTWTSSASASASTWVAGQWYHVVCSWNNKSPIDGTNYLKIYWNQTNVGGGQTTTWTISNVGTKYVIGTSQTTASTSNAVISNLIVENVVWADTKTNATAQGLSDWQSVEGSYGAGAGYDTPVSEYTVFRANGWNSSTNDATFFNWRDYNASTNTNGNLILDGNMEAAGTTGWNSWTGGTPGKDSNTTKFGTQSLSVTATATGSSQIIQIVTVAPGDNYYLSGWFNRNNMNSYRLYVYDSVGTNGTIYDSGAKTNTGWNRLEAIFTIPTGCTQIRIYVWFDAAAIGNIGYADQFGLWKQKVSNGSMEGTFTDGCPSGWSLNLGTGAASTDYRSGTQSFSISANTGEGAYQSLSGITNGKWYLLTYWLKITAGSVKAGFYQTTNDLRTTINFSSHGGVWKKYYSLFKANSGSNTQLNFYGGATGSTYLIDDVSVVEISSTTALLEIPSAQADSFGIGKWNDATGAFLVDGSDSLFLNNTSNMPMGTSGSVAGWFKLTRDFETNEIRAIVDCGGTGTNGLFIQVDTNKKVSIQVGTGSAVVNAPSVTVIGVGTWYHFVATWTPTTISTAINGVIENTVTTTPNIIFSPSFSIGREYAVARRWLDGWIDDLRFYDTALTAAQISMLYGHASETTWDSVDTTNLKSQSRFANDLDCECPVNNGWTSTAYSVSHIKGNRLLNLSGYWITNGDSEWTDVDISGDVTLVSGNEAHLAIRYKDDNNLIRFGITGLSGFYVIKRIAGVSTTLYSESGTMTLGTTYTLRGTIIGTTLTVYVNGVQKYTGTVADAPTSGKIGVQTWVSTNDSVSYFDNIEVKADIADAWNYNITPTHYISSPINAGSKTLKINYTGFGGGLNTDKYVEQTYVVVPSKPYTVSYQMNATSGKTPKVRWADSNGGSLNEVTVTVANGYWNKYSHTFTIPSSQGSALLDFSGKVAGSTTINPHIAKKADKTTFDAPNTYGIEFAVSDYANIPIQDGVVTTESYSVNGYYSQHLFQFDILTALKRAGKIPQSWDVTTLKANMTNVITTYVGYGVGSNNSQVTYGATMKYWNNSTNSWYTVKSNTDNTPNTMTDSTSASIPVFMDSNGLWQVLVHSTYPGDGTNSSRIYTDYIKISVTLANVALNIRWYPLDTTTIYLDKVQLEQLAYSTSYQRNDDLVNSYTRAAENLAIPTMKLSPDSGTWEGWVYVSPAMRRVTLTDSYPAIFHIPKGVSGAGLSNNGLALYRSYIQSTNTATWRVLTRNDADAASFKDFTDNLTDGWHFFALTWAGTTIKLYVDGVQLGTTFTSTSIPTSFSSYMYIGSWNSTSANDVGNTIYDDIRISNVVRTDTQILATYNATKGNYSDYATISYCDLDNDLYSQKDVKAILTPAGNLHIRGLKQIG